METEKKVMPGAFRLIKEAFGLYGRNYKTFFKIGLVMVGVGLVLGIISLLINPQSLIKSSLILYFIVTFVVAIIGTVLQMIYQTTLIKSIADVDTMQPTFSLKEIYSKGIKLFPSYLWINVLILLSAGSIVVIAMLATGLVGAIAAIVGGIAGIILLVIVYLVFVAVVAVITIYLSCAIYSLIIDNNRGLKALSASFYYVYKNWWRVFWRVLVPTVLILIVLAIIGVIVYFAFLSGKDPVTVSTEFRAFSSGYTISSLIISIIISIITSCIVVPIVNSYGYLLYKNLKSTKPEPVPEKDFATSKIWFTVLSIIGLVVGVGTLVIFILGIIAGYKNAGMRAQFAQQMQQNLPAGQSQFPAEAIALPVNLASLEQTPYTNSTFGFSMNIPKKWQTEGDTNGVFIAPNIKATNDADIVVEKRVLPAQASAIPTDKLMEQVAQGLLASAANNFTNISFQKYTISSTDAYVITGTMSAPGGQEINARYYFIRDGLDVYTITAEGKSSSWTALSNTLIDSVNTFKITK